MSAAHDSGGEALVGALEYVAAGYAVGPVTIRLGADGKKVARFHTSWERDPVGITSDPEQVKAWALRWPGCGWHAPCGPNGVVVAEGDVKGETSGVWNWRRAKGPSSPMTVTTRSGGQHWYFAAPDEPIRNSVDSVEGVPGVDVRGDGGTVFIAGTTVHDGGGHYWTHRVVPRDELPELPEAWADRLRGAGPSSRKSSSSARPTSSSVSSTLVPASAVHEPDWVVAKFDDLVRELHSGTAGFRDHLSAAALVGFRAVDLELIEEDEVRARLTEAVIAVWGAEPDRHDRKWIEDARTDASEQPWRLARPLERAGGETQDEPESAHEDAPPPSWAPVDLGPHLDGTHVAPTAVFLERSDGVALLYAGLVHWLYGESESGKSWVCLIAVLRVLLAGGRALIVDYESDAGAVVGRLRALGADVEAIRAGLVYVRPEVSCAQEPTSFAELLAQSFDVAVVDGVTEGLGIEGGVSVDNDDVTEWTRRIPRRIARETGAAVACVDHVTKNAEGRGRFPIGGQAKLAALDGAGYLVEPESAIRPGAKGQVVLRVAKDRPGSVRASSGEWRSSDRTQEAARITIDATDPTAIAVEISPPDATATPPGTFRPTVYMERVSHFLATTEGEATGAAIEKAVQGKADMIRRALDELVTLGYVTRRTGARNSILHTFVRRYTDLQRVARGAPSGGVPEGLSDPDDDHERGDDA